MNIEVDNKLNLLKEIGLFKLLKKRFGKNILLQATTIVSSFGLFTSFKFFGTCYIYRNVN